MQRSRSLANSRALMRFPQQRLHQGAEGSGFRRLQRRLRDRQVLLDDSKIRVRLGSQLQEAPEGCVARSGSHRRQSIAKNGRVTRQQLSRSLLYFAHACVFLIANKAPPPPPPHPPPLATSLTETHVRVLQTNLLHAPPASHPGAPGDMHHTAQIHTTPSPRARRRGGCRGGALLSSEGGHLRATRPHAPIAPPASDS